VVVACRSFLANPSNNSFSIGSKVTVHYLILKITNSNPEKKLDFFLTGRLPFLNYGINVKSFIQKQNEEQMKKLLFVLAIAAFAACNNSAETATEAAEATVDSTVATVEAAADSAKASIDSTASAAVDSAKAAVDSLKK
jgi:hypothetical protein